MAEYIISDDCLQDIICKSFLEGERGQGVYTVRGADGEEIIRCKDCKYLVNNHELSPLSGEYYDYLTCRHLTGLRVRAINPDGFCAWAERRA